MEFVRGIHAIKSRHQGCAITLGNFDGIHVGHQKILEHLAMQAKKRQLSTLLMTFEPHSKEFFQAKNAPVRLSTLREKLHFLSKLPLDYLLCLRFNESMATMTAEDFIKQILCQALQVKYLLIGEDFRFGRNREGDKQKLQSAGQRYGFTVETMPNIVVDDQRVSSTLVRELLAKGKLALAQQLLGQPYSMCGRVIHGDKRGRVLGFPTANIHRGPRLAPMTGIFVVEVRGLNNKIYPGVANLGFRPMFTTVDHLLEVHLLDFSKDIYGKYIQTDFLVKLRDEMKFDSLTALKEQMDQDVQNTRAYFHLLQRS